MLGLARVLHLPQSDCLRVPEGTKTSAPQTQPKPRATGHQRAWPVGRRCLSRMKRPASRSHGGGRVEPAASALGKDQPVHRLNRGGDRAANSALHRVVIVRMKSHEPTRAYVTRRTERGMSNRDHPRPQALGRFASYCPLIKGAALPGSDLEAPTDRHVTTYGSVRSGPVF